MNDYETFSSSIKHATMIKFCVVKTGNCGKDIETVSARW